MKLITAGESHGPAMTAVLSGIPAGLEITPEEINSELAKRQLPLGAGGRMKIETDRVTILAGVMAGRTTGAPIVLQVENRDHANWLGRDIPAYTIPRPGHADYAGTLKYGQDDIRPVLERASARETACRVAAGAVCKKLLAQFGITVSGRITELGGITSECAGEWEAAIELARVSGETLGGIIEVTASNLPIGLGTCMEPERRLDARIGAAVLSVQGIKGIEFGDAFAAAKLPGSHVHTPICKSHVDDSISREGPQSCGGIEGGMSCGMPLWFRAAMKPIPTILKGIESVNLATGESCTTKYERSDVCPVPRAVVVLEAVTAFVLADALTEALGDESLERMLAMNKLRNDSLKSKVTTLPKRFW